MNTYTPPAPRAPRDTARASRPAVASHPVTRAAFAVFAAKALPTRGASAVEIARQLWPGDATTPRLIQRDAADPMGTADHAALTQDSVGEFLSSMPLSAASRLFAMATQIPLEPDSQVMLPHRLAVPSTAPWVGEDEAIPVQEMPLGATALGPMRKCGVILTCSRELARRAGAVAIFETLLREAAAVTLDAALFNAAAAAADRPAGLLHDVAPVDTGTLSGPVEVLAALAGALGNAGGSGRVVIVTTPSLAMAAELHLPQLRWPVLPSLAVTLGTVIALDPAALAVAAGPNIDILTDGAATLHMEGTTPGAVMAEAPTRSLYQTASVGLRVILDISFAMRAPGRVQIAEGQAW